MSTTSSQREDELAQRQAELDEEKRRFDLAQPMMLAEARHLKEIAELEKTMRDTENRLALTHLTPIKNTNIRGLVDVFRSCTNDMNDTLDKIYAPVEGLLAYVPWSKSRVAKEMKIVGESYFAMAKSVFDLIGALDLTRDPGSFEEQKRFEDLVQGRVEERLAQQTLRIERHTKRKKPTPRKARKGCACSSNKGYRCAGDRCKCSKAGHPCSDDCNCSGNCNNYMPHPMDTPSEASTQPMWDRPPSHYSDEDYDPG